MHDVTVPPRVALAAEALAKAARGEPLTREEQRLIIWSRSRKWRRANKVRTTPIREELNALMTMKIVEAGPPATTYTGNTGNTAQHQQRYEAGQRTKARTEVPRDVFPDPEADARRTLREERAAADAARRARFDAARKAP
jgi:hypothetical protein